MKKRKIIAAAAILLALAGGFALTQNGLQVNTITIEPQTVNDTITEKGVMESGTSITQTAQVSGTISEICVKENQTVHAGDVLLRIDPTDLEQQRSAQQSVLEGYEAQLQQAKIETTITSSPAEYLAQLQEQLDVCNSNYATAERLYKAQQALYEAGGVSSIALEESKTSWLNAKEQLSQAQQRYDTSNQRLQQLQQQGIRQDNINEIFYQSVVQQAQSAVDNQQQVLQQLERSLQDCTVVAPADGIITQLPAENATAVQAGQTVAVLLQQKTPLVSFHLLSTEAPLLHLGDSVSLTNSLRSGDEIFSGTIVQMNDFAQTQQSSLGLEEHRVKVLVSLDSLQESLKDGYELKGTFSLYQKENAIAVPNSALFKVDDTWYVFLVQQGRAVQTPVTIGYQATAVTEILSGVQKGDQIVQNADTEGLVDGVKVHAS